VSGVVAGSSTNNLIGVSTGLGGISHGAGGNQVGTAAVPIDPRLPPLGGNVLLPGSPAIDAGNNAEVPPGETSDQRGYHFARIVNGTVDIGAYERQPSDNVLGSVDQPVIRVTPNVQVEVRWVADFGGDGKVEVFDNPNGTGTPIDGKVSTAQATSHTINFNVGGVIKADTTYYVRVTHHDPNNLRTDPTTDTPLPSFFTGAQPVAADLHVTATHSPEPSSVGDEVTFTYTVHNAGPERAVNVSLSAPLPANFEFVDFGPLNDSGLDHVRLFNGGSFTPLAGGVSHPGDWREAFQHGLGFLTELASGASHSWSIILRPTAVGSVSQTAVVTSDTRDPVSENNQAVDDSDVRPAVGTVGPRFASGPFVRVTPNFEDVFKTFNWVVGVEWFGKVEVFDNPNAAGTPVVAIPSGFESGHPIARTNHWVRFTGGLALDTTYYFRVTAIDPTGNSPSFSTPTPLPSFFTGAQLPVAANLSVTATHGPEPSRVGEDVTFSYTVNNSGPGRAANVRLTATLPAGFEFVAFTSDPSGCDFFSAYREFHASLTELASGASRTWSIIMRPTAAGTFSQTAVVTSDTSDPVPGNNRAVNNGEVRPPVILTSTTLAAANTTYTGHPYAGALSVTVTAGGSDVSGAGAISFAFYADAAGTTSIPRPANAGTYFVRALFTATPGSGYADSASPTVPFTIARAAPTVSVSGGTFLYNGLGHPATASITGVLGEDLGPATITYADSIGNAVAVPVEPGYYTATATFGGSPNYTAASATAIITIAFDANVLTDLSKPFKAGRVIPIMLQLRDPNGVNISSPNLPVRAVRLARVNADGSRTLVTLQDAGNSNPGNLFRYDAGLRGYIFNLSTKDLGPGLYEFFWLTGNDLTEHKLTFRLV